MLEYRETMNDVTKEDINYLNASVEEINEKVGREFIAICSTPDHEDNEVDIFENGIETWSCYPFEFVEMYLRGIKTGLLLMKD